MKVSRFASLSQKNGFVFVDQNLHFEPFPNIQSLRRFDWSFLQSSKYIYGKLWYKEKLFGKFQGLLWFTRKIVLYSLTKLGNFQRWTNIPWLRRFTIGFWETSKQIYRKLQYLEKRKQPSRRVLRKRCSETIQQIYRRTLMPKCDFNKFAKQLYWNCTSPRVFSCKLDVYFQNTFS